MCVRKSDNLEVSDQRCERLPRPVAVTEPCNTDCELRYASVREIHTRRIHKHPSFNGECLRLALTQVARRWKERVLCQMWAGLPQPGHAVYEVQPDEEAEREGGGQRVWKRRQTSGQGVLPRGLSAEELAVQRLVAGTATGSMS